MSKPIKGALCGPSYKPLQSPVNIGGLLEKQLIEESIELHILNIGQATHKLIL